MEKCMKNYECCFPVCCRDKFVKPKKPLAIHNPDHINLNNQNESYDGLIVNLDESVNEPMYRAIILDFSLVQFVDEGSIKILVEIIAQYKVEKIKILLCHCNGKYILKQKYKNKKKIEF
jgi:hypothetical protein